jgi:heme oxygenase (biliverdin-IX-beta and delta-forming)
MLKRLRSETQELHRRIETNPLHQAIVNGSITKLSYQRLLERMYGVHSCFEAEARQRNDWKQYQFDFDRHRRLHLLHLDLTALGVNPSSAQLPQPFLPLQTADFHFLLGYFYVLEGSTLGGQILSKLVLKHLGLTPSSGAAYLYADGPLTADRWRSCQSLLSQAGEFPQQADSILAGARDAFTRLDEWLRLE